MIVNQKKNASFRTTLEYVLGKEKSTIIDIGRLQHQGVKVYPQFSTRGLFKEAIAFELDGVKVAGNKIGSAYSFPGLLSKRGVSYDPERDLPALEAAAAGEVVSLHAPSPLKDTNQPPSSQISSGLSTSMQSTLIQDDEPTPIAEATQIAAYLQLFELLFDQREPSVAFAEATIEPPHLTPPSTSKPKPPEPMSHDRLQTELAQKLYPDPATIASLGLGLRWLITPDLSLRLDYGIPLVGVDNRGDSLQDNGIHFSVRYQSF